MQRPSKYGLTHAQSAERQQRIAQTYASGLPSERVAAEFGVSGHWVRAIARLYGVSRGYHAPKRRQG
jgi:DNA-binding CsgD family transcriptional regulator